MIRIIYIIIIIIHLNLAHPDIFQSNNNNNNNNLGCYMWIPDNNNINCLSDNGSDDCFSLNNTPTKIDSSAMIKTLVF